MLSNQQKNNLRILEDHIKAHFEKEASGHDFHHIKRVVSVTTRLMHSDDPYLYEALVIAWLHDVYDDKVQVVENLELSLRALLNEWEIDIEKESLDIILEGVSQIGYKGGFGVKDKNYPAQYVSDADYLDAMGAIGIARTFYYAGIKGTPLYDPNLEGVVHEDYDSYRNAKRNAIAHFDEKLLKLKDLMHTQEGKKQAEVRHQFMLEYVQHFYDEVSDVDIT